MNTFKMFRFVITIMILPITFIPMIVFNTLISEDWEDWLDGWIDYFIGD